MKVWLVQGSRGEYSDRWEWIESAHVDPAVARAKCDELGAQSRQAEKVHDDWAEVNHRFMDEFRDKGKLTPERQAAWDAHLDHEPEYHERAHFWVSEIEVDESRA